MKTIRSLLVLFLLVSAVFVQGQPLTQRNPVLEYCTGTWCQWCPCGHSIIANNVLPNLPNAVIIGYHGPANTGSDPYSTFAGNQIISALGFSGYPTGIVDRMSAPIDRNQWYAQLNARNSVPATVAINLQKTYTASTRQLAVNVSLNPLTDITGVCKVNVILLEDRLIYSQTGNASCTGGTNYVHQHVVRAYLNSYLGDTVGSGHWSPGQIVNKTYNYTLPTAYAESNCRLVALVYKVGGTLNTSEIQQAVQKDLMSTALAVLSPNGGENWYVGSSKNILWTVEGITNVKLEYSTDAGTSWNTIAASVTASLGTYAWTIPNTVSTHCLVRISDASNGTVFDVSNAEFTILQQPVTGWTAVTSGMTGDIWGIDYADANNVWISTSIGEVKRSTDGGATFVSAGNAGDGAYSIAALSATRAVVATGPSSGNGVIKLTTDGGTTWTQVYTATGAWFNFIDNLDANNLWALSDPISGVFHIVKSTDAGATWTLASNLPAAPASTVYGANDSWYQIGNTLWFGTGGASGATLANRVYKSTTGPNGPWTYSTTTAQFPGSMAFSSASGNGLVGFWQATNTMNKTTDGGGTFTAITTTNSLTHGLEYVQGTGIAYAASSTGLYKTTDNGATWTAETIPVGLTGEWYFVRMINNGTAGLCGGQTGILMRYTGGAPVGSVTVTAPNGGETWQAGAQKNITWTSSNVTNVKIEYTTNNGTAWTTVAASVAATPAAYAWTVPNTPSTQCKVKISDASNATVTDMSDNVFTITAAGPTITWQSVINLKDAGTDNQNLTIGASPQATNGMDPALGEVPLPPAPPTGIFDARLEIPTTPPDYSLKDFRPDTLQLVTWVMKFQPSAAGYPMNFTWNSATLPTGNFTLNDMITGTIVNVNMKTQGSYQLTNTGITALKITYSRQICKDVSLASGWNILSVPVTAASMATGTLFPLATSPAYGFNNNYVLSNTLEIGKGYFLRYPQAAVINICGNPATVRTIPLLSGWNIIGMYDYDAPVAALTTTPAGIITSPFYGYSAGYQQATNLTVGKGYWVRASSAGVLNLPITGELVKNGIPELRFENDWGRIIITDAQGNSSVLYAAKNNPNLSQYDLPPVPPQSSSIGGFDARFSSQRSVEVIGASGQDISISSAAYPIQVRFENISGRITDRATNGKLLNTAVRPGETIRIDNPSINALNVISADKPMEYALYQNYPNPFNPATVISYQIPQSGLVTLKVYDALGNEVAALVNEQHEAGSYNVTFDGSKLNSGVYFYSLRSGDFISTKKLILIK